MFWTMTHSSVIVDIPEKTFKLYTCKLNTFGNVPRIPKYYTHNISYKLQRVFFRKIYEFFSKDANLYSSELLCKGGDLHLVTG